MTHTTDQQWMDQAVALAWKGRKRVQSNPMVGAVFVKNGKKISEGYHQQWGGLHAETEAIEAAHSNKKSLKGSTAYVTLEPCCHEGKQGPCTDALLKEGIAEVVYAQQDPNPIVAGKGIKKLKNKGIETRMIQTWETQALNALYLKNTRTNLPFVHIKTACTQEGKITFKRGTETPLGSPESHQRVHEYRDRYDGILVGVNTILIDNPRLTARRPEALNPVRFILDSHLKTPSTAQIFSEPGKTILVTLEKKPPRIAYPGDTEIWSIPASSDGGINLVKFLEKAFQNNLRSLLIEGGEKVNTAFLKNNLVDRLSLIVTPHTLPSPRDKSKIPSVFKLKEIPSLEFTQSRLEIVGNDVWLEGFTKH